jgi:hypothetical protein
MKSVALLLGILGAIEGVGTGMAAAYQTPMVFDRHVATANGEDGLGPGAEFDSPSGTGPPISHRSLPASAVLVNTKADLVGKPAPPGKMGSPAQPCILHMLSGKLLAALGMQFTRISRQEGDELPRQLDRYDNRSIGGHRNGVFHARITLQQAAELERKLAATNGPYGKRFGPLHIGKTLTQRASDGTVQVYLAVHIDSANPNQTFWSAVEHLWRDVIVGTLGQWFSGLNLDPPCAEEPNH